MNVYFILTILFLSYCFFLCGKNRVLDKLMFVLLLLWMWVLLAFNKGGVDYETYEALFRLSKKVNFLDWYKGEILFKNLMYLFKIKGLSFFELSFLTQTLGTIILYSIIRKYSYLGIRSFSLICFFIFPLVDNIIQKRNFLSMMLTIKALSYLIDKTKYKKIKFTVLILLSFAIHSSSIICFLYLLVDYFDIRSIKRISKKGAILLLILLPIVPKILEKIMPFQESKINLYFYNLSNRLTLEKAVIFIIFHLIFFYLILFFSKKVNINDNNFNKIVLKLNYISLFFLPLYFYNLIFFRYYRNIYILNYIFIGNIIYKNINRNKVNILKIILIFYLILMFAVFYGVFGKYKYKGLVEPLFEKNLIIEKIS